jgi:hypothetical protein
MDPRGYRADYGRRSWGGGQGAGANATVEQFLIRGLVTACQACGERDDKSSDCRAISDTSIPNGPAISPIVAQKEAPNALPCLPDIFDTDRTRPDEIAHSLVGFVWHPYRCELASAREPRQQDRIASVGLDAIAGPARSVRRRDDLTHMASCVDLTVQAVPTWACFVHDVQFAVPIAKLLEHASHGIRGVADPAVETHITRSPISNGNGDRFLVDIEPEIGAKVRHGPSPLCMRIGAESAQPSFNDLHIVRRTTSRPPLRTSVI